MIHWLRLISAGHLEKSHVFPELDSPLTAVVFAGGRRDRSCWLPSWHLVPRPLDQDRPVCAARSQIRPREAPRRSGPAAAEIGIARDWLCILQPDPAAWPLVPSSVPSSSVSPRSGWAWFSVAFASWGLQRLVIPGSFRAANHPPPLGPQPPHQSWS